MNLNSINDHGQTNPPYNTSTMCTSATTSSMTSNNNTLMSTNMAYTAATTTTTTTNAKEKPNLNRIKIESDKSSNSSIYYRSSVDIDLKPHLSNTLGLSLIDGCVNIKEEEYMSSR